jgi:hypothetical protein
MGEIGRTARLIGNATTTKRHWRRSRAIVRNLPGRNARCAGRGGYDRSERHGVAPTRLAA